VSGYDDQLLVVFTSFEHCSNQLLCTEWFHGRCIGISEKDVPDHYYCDQCDDASDEEATSQKEQRQGKKGRKSAKSKPFKGICLSE
jgi:hypothetical protein